MKPLEILIAIILLTYLLWPFLTAKKRPPAVGVLPAFSLIVASTQINVEGYRAQMLPLYILSVFMFLFSLSLFLKARNAPDERPQGSALSWHLAGIILLVAAVIVAL